jgi:tellurite resistance protein TerC
MPDDSRQYRIARRIAAAVIGGTLLVLGTIMLVTPGPGTPTIAAGLGVLALEFYWARRWLVRLRQRMRRLGVYPPRRR